MHDKPITSLPILVYEKPSVPLGHEAILRLAEEMGRLVGKFLADEFTQKNYRLSLPAPVQEKKP